MLYNVAHKLPLSGVRVLKMIRKNFKKELGIIIDKILENNSLVILYTLVLLHVNHVTFHFSS